MTNEVLLATLVREWSEAVLPAQQAAADAAAALALQRYAEGSTVDEACIEARRLVGSWARHPSHGRVRRDGPWSTREGVRDG